MNSQFENHQPLIWPENGSAEQAAYWFALIDSERCTEANRRAFALWRRENEENEAAYLALIDQCLAIETLADDPDILALRRQALRPVGKVMPWRRAVAAVAACFVAAVAVLISFSLKQEDAVTYSVEASQPNNSIVEATTNEVESHIATAIGEQITKILVDGSKVILNTDSEVRIQFTDDKRILYLLRGQAFFDVAHDADRPFIVYANGQRVTALGTQFEVRINQKDVQVILLEGKVKVDELTIPDGPDSIDAHEPVPLKSVELTPGQKFSSLQDQPVIAEKIVIENVLNWKRGLINYTGEPLEDVISELNRYSVRKIELADSAIGRLGISGTLKTGSIDQQALKLAAIYDLGVEIDPNTQNLIINWKQK